MRMLQRPSQTNLTNFKRLIEQGADQIAGRWLESVHADCAIPSTEGVEESLLLDAVPLVLDEILRVVELDDGKIEHEKICSAALHGRERARQHFDVKEVVREYQLLRQHIFLYLNEHVAKFAARDIDDIAIIYYRVGLAIDKATSETINAFVEESTEHLRHLSRTDSLTNLFNHRTFYERLDEELKRAKRYESPLSIVLIDLDNFKTVNDTNGHQFGDYLLMKCAEWLRRELRETDVICRYGGDEFGVILPETTREDAHAMMCRLTVTFKELGKQEGTPPSFGMSYGLSSHPEDNGTVMRLVQVADERLTLNKHGSSQVITSSSKEAA